jgi:membrane protease YdiL (CAAX protease family)
MVAVKAERWVLALAMVLPTAAAVFYFVVLPSDAATPRANPFMLAAYYGSKVVQFALPVVWVAIVEPGALRPRRVSFRGVPTGLIFGVGVAALVFGLYYNWLAGSASFADLPGRVRRMTGQFGVSSPAGFLALAVGIAVIHSLFEEYYWRWFVYGRLRRHVPVAAALVIAGLAFTGHHVVVLGVYFPEHVWPIVLPFSLAVAVGGIVWAWLYERTGSLLGPWLSHVIVDLALMAVGYDLAFRAA